MANQATIDGDETRAGLARIGLTGPGVERAWTCACWDCVAFRRRVLRRGAVVVALVALAAAWGYQAGLWSSAVGPLEAILETSPGAIGF